jgi:uncharacterized protein (UPF0332 family)
MPDDRKIRTEYANYRLERAAEDLETAKSNFEEGHYRAANNRAYYSIFHSIRAVLALENFDSPKHGGVIGEFRRRYIKEGLIPIEVSKMIGSAFTIRNASDYDDMFIASKDETAEQISNAEYVYDIIKRYIDDITQVDEN